jgi:hypothetical protein
MTPRRATKTQGAGRVPLKSRLQGIRSGVRGLLRAPTAEPGASVLTRFSGHEPLPELPRELRASEWRPSSPKSAHKKPSREFVGAALNVIERSFEPFMATLANDARSVPKEELAARAELLKLVHEAVTQELKKSPEHLVDQALFGRLEQVRQLGTELGRMSQRIVDHGSSLNFATAEEAEERRESGAESLVQTVLWAAESSDGGPAAGVELLQTAAMLRTPVALRPSEFRLSLKSWEPNDSEVAALRGALGAALEDDQAVRWLVGCLERLAHARPMLSKQSPSDEHQIDCLLWELRSRLAKFSADDPDVRRALSAPA